MELLRRCDSSQKIEQQFTRSECSDFKLLSIKLGPSSPFSFRPESFESWDLDKPASQASGCTGREVPRLQDNHFRLGKDPADQEAVIYMRLDRSDGVLNVFLISYAQLHHSTTSYIVLT